MEVRAACLLKITRKDKDKLRKQQQRKCETFKKKENEARKTPENRAKENLRKVFQKKPKTSAN